MNKVCKQWEFKIITAEGKKRYCWKCLKINIQFNPTLWTYFEDPMSYIKYCLKGNNSKIQILLKSECPYYNKLELLARLQML